MSIKRVAFVWEQIGWMGGVNYFKNLFSAINVLPNSKIKPILITGNKSDCHGLDEFVEVIRTPLLDRRSLPWIMSKIVKKILFGRNYMLFFLLKKYRIDLVSHFGDFWKGSNIPWMPWIPDFQHMHLPECFTANNLRSRDECFSENILSANAIILSSKNAQNDLHSFCRKQKIKLPRNYVLPFMSELLLEMKETPNNSFLCDKYKLDRPWFYLPNQFWVHKNHQVVIEALRLLKKSDGSILVISTGEVKDSRDPKYFDGLMNQVKKYELQENFVVLGKVSYEDVCGFMAHSMAVINPSLFEGWSSTVEEAKSMGKTLLLSNIDVHREQEPERGIYFNPKDPKDLAAKLKDVVCKFDMSIEEKYVQNAIKNITSRKLKFAENYKAIVMDLLGI